MIQGPFALAQMGLPIADHVIVIGIDGLTPAGIKAASTPVIDSLLRHAAYTFACEAVMPTSSSPNWASMIMGAPPELHGVTSNGWEPGSASTLLECEGKGGNGRPSGMWPTIFGELRRQRPEADIACFHDWRDFGRLIEKGVLSRHARTNLLTALSGRGHFSMTRKAVNYFEKNTPQLLFIHLDNVDHAGHEYGYTTPEYHSAIAEVDRCIGQVINAVALSGKADRTVILITSDHGGVGKGHGGDTPDERLVPWILNGKKVVHGEILGKVRTFDTAATLAYILGLPAPSCWTGKTVMQAFPQ